MAFYSLGIWLLESIQSNGEYSGVTRLSDINAIFFDEFFMLLILTDVLLLLFSFFNTSKFHLVIRNSAFVISTILIRLSFGVEGLLNNLLIIVAVLYGVLVLAINRKYILNL